MAKESDDKPTCKNCGEPLDSHTCATCGGCWAKCGCPIGNGEY